MAFVYHLDTSPRKSHKHGTSGRRSLNYDKYGQPLSSLGSSSAASGREPVGHVLRVRPDGAVTHVLSSSSTTRTRSWTIPRIIETNTTRRSSYPHPGGDTRDIPLKTALSPHPRLLEISDDRMPSKYHVEVDHPRDSHRTQIPSHPFIGEDHYPEFYYHEPHILNSHFSPPHHTEPHHRQERYHMEPHRREEFHEIPQHVPSPMDVPILSRSPTSSDCSFHSFSISDSDSVNFNQVHPGEPCYLDNGQSSVPVNVPIHTTSSPRRRRLSFDFPSAGKPPPLLLSSSLPRTVHFREDPVLPTPAPRRKGWWNRKGDQLWDNEGAYAPAEEHDLYPPDLRGYPEPGTGWMNEEGIQIDMKRRRVRRKPLRSAMKKKSPQR